MAKMDSPKWKVSYCRDFLVLWPKFLFFKYFQMLKGHMTVSIHDSDMGSVMVCGCMTQTEVGKLHLIEGRMEHFGYIEILEVHLQSEASILQLLI